MQDSKPVIAIWGHPDVTWTHANVIITVNGVEWVIDRNYSPAYPVLPMTVEDWYATYKQNIYRVDTRKRSLKFHPIPLQTIGGE